MKTKSVVLPALLAILFGLGPVAAEQLSPESVPGATTVDTDHAKRLFDQEAAFIDVRKASEWDAGRIPGAINLDLKSGFDEASLAGEVGKDEPVVFYCNGPKCPRSAKAAEDALGWGWSKVYYYREGFPAWRNAALPIE